MTGDDGEGKLGRAKGYFQRHGRPDRPYTLSDFRIKLAQGVAIFHQGSAIVPSRSKTNLFLNRPQRCLRRAGNGSGKYADATEKVLGMHYFN